MTGHEAVVVGTVVLGLTILVIGLLGLRWYYKTANTASISNQTVRQGVWMVSAFLAVVGLTTAVVGLLAASISP